MTARILDCRGMRCPRPVIELARLLRDAPVGTTVVVVADDPAAALDVPAWCRLRGHLFLGAEVVEGAPGLRVRKLAEPG